MFDFKRIRFWWLIISIQVLLTAIVPSVVLMMLPALEAPVKLEISGVVIEAPSPLKARAQIEAFCESIVAEGRIIVETNAGTFNIPYSTIGLQIDTGKLQEFIQNRQARNRFYQLAGRDDDELIRFDPDIYINEAQFIDSFTNIREIYRTDSQNAGLILQDGALTIIPHSDGYEFDVQKALRFVKEQLQSGLSKEILLTADSSFLSTIHAEVTEQQLQRYSGLYGVNQGNVPEGSVQDFRNLVQSLEDIWIQPGETFSLKDQIASFTPSDPLTQLLASCIYQAVLPVEDVRILWRKAANQPVQGIEPGLEVNLDNDGDLQFKNTSGTPLILMFEITDSGRYCVALAGTPGLRVGELKTQQSKIPPSVIYSQSNTLPENAKEVIEPGKEGLNVKVYRVIGGETEKLYEDVYQPIQKIIAVGTGVKKEDLVRK